MQTCCTATYIKVYSVCGDISTTHTTVQPEHIREAPRSVINTADEGNNSRNKGPFTPPKTPSRCSKRALFASKYYLKSEGKVSTLRDMDRMHSRNDSPGM